MKQVLLLLPHGFEMLEAAAFIDVFGWNEVAGDKSTRLICAGKEKYIPTSFAHSMQADILLDEVNIAEYDALAIPGGFARYGYYDAKADQQLTSIIRNFAVTNKPIAVVCTASLLLGAAGILRDRKATTYQGEDGRWLSQLADYGAFLSNNNPCVDNNIITSSAPSSAPYVALTLLEKITNDENSANVAEMMGYKKAPRD